MKELIFRGRKVVANTDKIENRTFDDGTVIAYDASLLQQYRCEDLLSITIYYKDVVSGFLMRQTLCNAENLRVDGSGHLYCNDIHYGAITWDDEQQNYKWILCNRECRVEIIGVFHIHSMGVTD